MSNIERLARYSPAALERREVREVVFMILLIDTPR